MSTIPDTDQESKAGLTPADTAQAGSNGLISRTSVSGYMARRRWEEFGLALLYMTPALLLFIVFTFIPFFRSVYLSFFVTDPKGEPARFNELNYYGRIFNIGDAARGDDYLKSIMITFQFALMVVPLGIITSVALAVLATVKVRIIGVFRTIFTSSIAISVASAGVIWSLIYSPNVKITQWIIELLNLKATSLLNDASTALAAVAFMTVWTSLGFNFIITLSGIQAIPTELYESSLIDGANGWKAFRYITLPLLSPTLLFLFIISTISCFQAFTQFNVLIGSEGPDKSTNVFVYAIYKAFWSDNRYGFASSMAVVLFVILLILTFIQFRLLDRRVHYQ